MNIKRLLIVLICLFVLTGCKIENISSDNIIDNVELILNKNIKYTNQNAIGYQYNLPSYMSVIDSNDFNEVIYYNGKNLYLYADVVSYYHKVSKKYKINNDAYLSKNININHKEGYLEVNEVDDKYYVEMMYNYAKFEAYIEKDELIDAVSSISYILSSIKYNDNVIETLIGDSKYDLSGNETYNIFETKKNTDGNFLDWVNEYDTYNGSTEVESLIEKEEISTEEDEDGAIR